MNILQVHNYYKQSGGEDNVLKREKKLLEEREETVSQFIKSNEDINGFWDYIKVGLNTRYSKNSYYEFNRVLEIENPDIIHCHNFFPLISPSIFDCTTEKEIPSLLTLHNYRLLHPNGLMLYNGHIDERPLEGSAYQCVLDGVYRDSIIQTAVVANMIEYHKKKKTWQDKVDGFIALTEFAKNKFIEGGLPKDKIHVKPNFVGDPFRGKLDLGNNEKKEGYFFVGRISKEKGIDDLVSAWLSNKKLPSLNIAGDGPLKSELQYKTSDCSNIKWLGKISNSEVLQWLNRSKAMIFPSTWYEGFPMTILESLSVGCPVITSNIGSQQSIIDNEVTGLHFRVSDRKDLLNKVGRLERNNALVRELGANAREKYLQEYTPEKNYRMLMEIYEGIRTN